MKSYLFTTDPVVVGVEECEVLQMLPRAVPPPLVRDERPEKVQGDSGGKGREESAALHNHGDVAAPQAQ